MIASVSTLEAGLALEQRAQGYVRALVLDPHEVCLQTSLSVPRLKPWQPATTTIFLRSLTSTLSRKFPITSSGDPYASPSAHPYIQSVICLLTLPISVPTVYAPLEHISLRDTYLPYLNATHITPLQVIQGLLPLLRTDPARARDKGKKTIVVCLPAIEACIGLPFDSIRSMSAASTLRGIEVLRREISLAALTDHSDSMKNIKVVTANVGALSIETDNDEPPTDHAPQSMQDWSPSEKMIYGPAFTSILQAARPSASPLSRRPTDVGIFVDNIISVVTGGRHQAPLLGLGHTLGRLRNWIRGNRFSIGAGGKCILGDEMQVFF